MLTWCYEVSAGARIKLCWHALYVLCDIDLATVHKCINFGQLHETKVAIIVTFIGLHAYVLTLERCDTVRVYLPLTVGIYFDTECFHYNILLQYQLYDYLQLLHCLS